MPPYAAFDEPVETPSKTAVGIEIARRLANDGTRRHGNSVDSVTVENLGDCWVRLRDSEMALPLPGEDVRIARGHQRVDGGKGAGGL
jgi:hypothetical protein